VHAGSWLTLLTERRTPFILIERESQARRFGSDLVDLFGEQASSHKFLSIRFDIFVRFHQR
jgi:hypothetical protein